MTATSPSKETILVADDEASIRRILETRLSMIGYQVVTACDGNEALDLFRNCEPDLVVLDVMMPKRSGFEVCQHLKSDPKTSSIMILMVTALNELGDIERAVHAGTDDFLSKPVNKPELLKRVENMLALKDTRDENERLRRYIEKMDEPAT